MSPRQIAEAMAGHTVELLLHANTPELFKKIIADALQIVAEEETKREREACAVIADEEADSYDGDRFALVAERIRARGTK